MTTPLISLLIFVLVLFLYVHLMAHFKKTYDTTIFEMDYSGNPVQLHDVCALKQPMLFGLPTHVDDGAKNLAKLLHPDYLAQIGSSFDVKLVDMDDYATSKTADPVRVPVRLSHALAMLTHDTDRPHYFSDHNEEFMEDIGVKRPIADALDYHLRPISALMTTHDLWLGSRGANTPLRYHTHTRAFLMVHSGSVRVKMTSWKSNKYLRPISDYDAYEFRSPMDVWKPQPEFEADFSRVRFMDFTISADSTFNILYIPSYWWFSIQYSPASSSGGSIDTVATMSMYDTPIGVLANIPHFALHILQQWNIQHHPIKPKNDEFKTDHNTNTTTITNTSTAVNVTESASPTVSGSELGLVSIVSVPKMSSAEAAMNVVIMDH